MKQLLLVAFLVAAIAPAQATTLKLATLAPDGTTWMKEFRKSAALIAKQTNNRVKIKFYPGGIMGNEKSVLRKIRLGQLQGGAMTSGGLNKISSKNQIYGLPFKFKTYDEVDYVRARMDHVITDAIEKKGYVTFGLAEGGFAYIMSKVPVERFMALKGKKVWTPEGDAIARTLMETYDLSPTALPLTDVLTGLQTGLIDVVAATPSFAIALQWHSKVNYLTYYPVFYSIGAFIISKKAFKKISPADQKIVRKELSSVVIKLNKINREDNKKALLALKKYGIKFIIPDAEAEKALNDITATLARKLLAQGAYTPSVLKRLDENLAQFRKNKKSTAKR